MVIRCERIRMTIASLMALIAALSLLFLVAVPLHRVGRPPCLTPIRTARWLVARPGVAHCADCHSRPRLKLSRLRDLSREMRLIREPGVED
jgi:hypothetical protein